MPTIAEVRKQYPQYQDMTDQQLGDALYKKFYSDMPREQFNAKVGLSSGANGTPDDALGMARTGLGGAIEGIPVIGPAIRRGAEMAAAGTIAPFSEKTYGEILSGIDKENAAEKQANPIIDTASQIGGAVAGTIPLIAAAPGAFGVGAGSLAARSAASAASGAALGGADAAVRSGGDMSAAMRGAEWGGGLGLLAPGIGAVAGKGVNAVTRRVRGPSAAERAIGRAANADAVNAEDVASRLGGMGPDAMVMDLGPNLQRQAGALAATPGRGQEVVRSAIADRGANAGARVSDAATKALGSPVDTMAVAEDIIAKRSAAAKPLYDAAYSKPMPFSPDLKNLLQRPAMKSALRKAEKLAADEGLRSKQWFARFSDGGERSTGILDVSGKEISAPNPQNVTFTRTPDVRELDLTKRALDDMISTAQRAGNNNEARIFTQLKNKLTGLVDKAVPEYAQAREAFSGPSAILDAMEEGQKAFRNTLTPNELRTRLMKMGAGEKEAFIQGARSHIADIMGTARNDALAARSTFDKGYNKEKLGLLIGKDNADRMLNSLDAERSFTRTRDVVTGNSETAARLAAQNEIAGGATDLGIIRQFDISKPGATVAAVGDKIMGAAKAAAQGRSNEELARMLTSGASDAQTITQAIKAVQSAARRGQIAQDQAQQLVRALVVSGAQDRSTALPAPAAMQGR